MYGVRRRQEVRGDTWAYVHDDNKSRAEGFTERCEDLG